LRRKFYPNRFEWIFIESIPAHPRQKVEAVRMLEADEEADVDAEVDGRVGQAEADFKLKSCIDVPEHIVQNPGSML
jgi:hypothetical protein